MTEPDAGSVRGARRRKALAAQLERQRQIWVCQSCGMEGDESSADGEPPVGWLTIRIAGVSATVSDVGPYCSIECLMQGATRVRRHVNVRRTALRRQDTASIMRQAPRGKDRDLGRPVVCQVFVTERRINAERPLRNARSLRGRTALRPTNYSSRLPLRSDRRGPPCRHDLSLAPVRDVRARTGRAVPGIISMRMPRWPPRRGWKRLASLSKVTVTPICAIGAARGTRATIPARAGIKDAAAVVIISTT